MSEVEVEDTQSQEKIITTEASETYEPAVRIDSEPGEYSTSGLREGSQLRAWAEVSKINYLSSRFLDVISSGQSIRRRSIGVPVYEALQPSLRHISVDELFAEQFAVNVTSLLNEDQYWWCFYNFPELYADNYSPVVRIRELADVAELVNGVLTRDMVTACLTYLKRTPILGDFVYIKLDLSMKHLKNIDILQHYKYLVYLDLSTNYLTELLVLKYLLYLQYVSVAYNRLSTVLEYDTPQWFLTEVHYKYNSVKRIRDLSMFWSITILDLSHNNIKAISGLESLRFLRRLDLSFNHIQKLENLNHLRLVWLDVSYNNISSFEFGPDAGLWTLLHLEYLDLNENNLTSMRMFSGCTRLQKLHVRNNRLAMLLELAVYMRQMRRLVVLDLRANPICSTPGYKDVVIHTFPLLLNLDAEGMDPVEQRTSKMDMVPEVMTFATRRLLRLMYIEQLSKAKISPFIPPADTTEVQIVVLVGHEAVGKGTLARRLADLCSDHVELALLHTTAQHHMPGHYIQISRNKFDDMLLAGEFLTYSEMDGESYGLSRDEAFIKDGKVKIATMDLVGALMLQLRGRRPYLILVSCMDKIALSTKQQHRKNFRNTDNQQRMSMEPPNERSTLQVLLSGRIIITGILNEILLFLPEEKEQSEFVIESECSLMMDSEARQAMKDYARGVNMLTLLNSSSSSVIDDGFRRSHDKTSQAEPSLYSLYKESQGTGEYISYVNGQNSLQERKNKKTNDGQPSKTKNLSITHPKSVDFSRYTSSTWKGLSMVPDSSKSSKSVTFTSTEAEHATEIDPSGLVIESPQPNETEPQDKSHIIRSISARNPWPHKRVDSGTTLDDMDLWLAFLTEIGAMMASDIDMQPSTVLKRVSTQKDDPIAYIRDMENYKKFLYQPACDAINTNVKGGYESVHYRKPGLFRDTIMTDNRDEAYKKLEGIVRRLVNSQNIMTPMFDIDFANLKHYPEVERKLNHIHNQIAASKPFL